MIIGKNLSYSYSQTQMLQFPNLKVDAGQTLLISGDSGCGKTTLLHLLAGLRTPYKGEVLIDNEQLSEMSSAKLDQFRGEQIGVIFQQSFFIPSINVFDNLNLSPFGKKNRKIDEVTEKLGISELLNYYPNQLSQGQQQRCSIARALINNPKVVLADEPTSALDDKNCSMVAELLINAAKNQNAALIIVSHDYRLKKKIDQKIILKPIDTI
ncbi:ABC transporter ATP-binding protein [Crocinitomix algicola]|uniref:ABC transporter ATP-binding protein n=1 Tax=Crocinitomix algicola TaxID=1740263 RepID=UPI000836AB7D|nr:ATP-binding cassette domain-containing protein [Crocinitomix algicola]